MTLAWALLETNSSPSLQRVQHVHIGDTEIPQVQSVAVEYDVNGPPVLVLRCVVGGVVFEDADGVGTA